MLPAGVLLASGHLWVFCRLKTNVMFKRTDPEGSKVLRNLAAES